MKFFAFLGFAATATASSVYTMGQKEQAFEMWTAQMESGEIDEEVYTILCQALDGDMPEDFYAEADAEEDAEEMPRELAEAGQHLPGTGKWTGTKMMVAARNAGNAIEKQAGKVRGAILGANKLVKAAEKPMKMRSKVMAARKPAPTPMPAPMVGKPDAPMLEPMMGAPAPTPAPTPAPMEGRPAPPRAVMSKPIVPKKTMADPQTAPKQPMPKKVVKAIAKAENKKDGFNKNKTVESDDDDDFDVTGEFSLPPPPMRPVKKLSVNPAMVKPAFNTLVKPAIKPVKPVGKLTVNPAMVKPAFNTLVKPAIKPVNKPVKK